MLRLPKNKNVCVNLRVSSCEKINKSSIIISSAVVYKNAHLLFSFVFCDEEFLLIAFL